jgi:hypothetical protein
MKSQHKRAHRRTTPKLERFERRLNGGQPEHRIASMPIVMGHAHLFIRQARDGEFRTDISTAVVLRIMRDRGVIEALASTHDFGEVRRLCRRVWQVINAAVRKARQRYRYHDRFEWRDDEPMPTDVILHVDVSSQKVDVTVFGESAWPTDPSELQRIVNRQLDEAVMRFPGETDFVCSAPDEIPRPLCTGERPKGTAVYRRLEGKLELVIPAE